MTERLHLPVVNLSVYHLLKRVALSVRGPSPVFIGATQDRNPRFVTTFSVPISTISTMVWNNRIVESDDILFELKRSVRLMRPKGNPACDPDSTVLSKGIHITYCRVTQSTLDQVGYRRSICLSSFLPLHYLPS